MSYDEEDLTMPVTEPGPAYTLAELMQSGIDALKRAVNWEAHYKNREIE